MGDLIRTGDASHAHSTGTARAALILGCLVLPWVNPLTWGPSATVVPWLVSAACAVLLWGFLMPAGASRQPPDWWAKRVADGWLVAALVSCVIGLVQYFGLTTDLGPLMSGSAIGEAFGNLRQRNQFATLTMLGMAVLLWRVSLDPDDMIAWPAAVLLAVANAASASRTGLLQLLMLAAFCAIWRGPHVRRQLVLCLAAGIAYCAAALLLPILLEAATGVTAPSVWGRIGRQEGCSSRLVLWSNVLHLIAERPWVGWGWGELDYAHYFTLYPGARFCDILDNAHNLPLHLAVELGVPAAILLCAGFLWWVVRAKAWREVDATRQLAWSALALILLHSMLEYPLWYGPFQIAFVLALTLLWRPSPATAARVAGQAPLAKALRSGVALALLAALAVNAWDYHRVSQIYLPPEARAADLREDTLARIRDSRFFPSQVRFAELTITPLTTANAQWTFDTALAMLHFSPEPRVIEKVIESAIVLGRDAEAATHLARFRAAFPAEYKRWSASRERVPAGAIKD